MRAVFKQRGHRAFKGRAVRYATALLHPAKSAGLLQLPTPGLVRDALGARGILGREPRGVEAPEAGQHFARVIDDVAVMRGDYFAFAAREQVSAGKPAGTALSIGTGGKPGGLKGVKVKGKSLSKTVLEDRR